MLAPDTPGSRVAARYLQKLGGLSPPFDVLAVVRSLATVEPVGWIPGAADAVTTGLKLEDRRPHVIFNSNRPQHRINFTLAHELGHILIPWHVGVIVSHAESEPEAESDTVYRDMEREANEFAAEFLAPTDWIRGLLRSAPSLKDLYAQLRTAGLSPLAAAIRMSSVLPPGFLFVQTDHHGRVQFSGRSPGTHASVPLKGSLIEEASLLETCDEVARADDAAPTWLFRFQPSSGSSGSDRGDPQVLLSQILSDTCSMSEEHSHLRQAIAGIVGNANNGGRSVQEMVERVRQRVASNSKYRLIWKHPLFLKTMWLPNAARFTLDGGSAPA